MNGRVWIRVLLGLVLLAAVAGVAFFAYNAGVAQEYVQGSIVAAPGDAAPGLDGFRGGYPFYGGPFGFHQPFGFHRPFGFGFGFGPLGCLFPLLFGFLIFGLIRGLLWGGGGWGWRRGWHPGHHGPWEGGLPPRFEEWHRKAHEAPSQPAQDKPS